MTSDEPTPEHLQELAVARMEVLDAFAAAIDDRQRVLAIVGDAATGDQARNVLMNSFGWTPLQADAVLDLQFRRLNREARERIANERDELAAQLGQ